MHQLRGCGLPNVYLLNGFKTEGEGDLRQTAYEDIDGLYRAIGMAIAVNDGAMTAAELRFLRKRLHMSQDDVGELGGKTGQMAAQWEKGTRPVPVAEARLLRLRYLLEKGRSFSRSLVSNVMARGGGDLPVSRYIFSRLEDRWGSHTRANAQRVAKQADTTAKETIELVMSGRVAVRMFSGGTGSQTTSVTTDSALQL